MIMKVSIAVAVGLIMLTAPQTVGDAKNEDQGHGPPKKICKAAGTPLTITLPDDFSDSDCTLTINKTDVFSCRYRRPVFGLQSAEERIKVFCHNNTAVIPAVHQVDEGSYASCNHTGSCIHLLDLEVKPDEQSCRGIIKDGKTKIVFGGIAGVVVFIVVVFIVTIFAVTFVVVLVIYYRKKFRAQRPDEENAKEMVPLD